MQDIIAQIPAFQTEPFRYILSKLTEKTIAENEARQIWVEVLKNKQDMERRLERIVSIKTAAVDFFERRDAGMAETRAVKKHPIALKIDKTSEEWLKKVFDPGYHLEKLKEEMLRAKRYKHALSVILLDVDQFYKVNERLSFQGGDAILATIVKIIRKTIRTVDILARYAGDRFVLILPNTNKREAMELAERLSVNVKSRTSRIAELESGVSITASVGQCAPEDSSLDFMYRMDRTLERGKSTKRDAIYPL
jgi:diguanylate cyclase (GGDEF)-like protein